jgi:hypothetical protein
MIWEQKHHNTRAVRVVVVVMVVGDEVDVMKGVSTSMAPSHHVK